MNPRSCYREDGKPKRAFYTKRDAKNVLRKGQLIYECRNCSYWHLASKH